MSAAVDQAGIDYHVILAQNALQQCLDMPELQAELICALIKQTSKSSPLPKLGVQVSTQKSLKKSVSVLLACFIPFRFSQRHDFEFVKLGTKQNFNKHFIKNIEELFRFIF